jgi:hypothetical protein
MKEKLEQLQVLLEEDKNVFLVELELLNPVPSESELNKFQSEFPEVVKSIKEMHRIGFYN